MHARAGTAFVNGEYIDMARDQRTRAAVAACALASRSERERGVASSTRGDEEVGGMRSDGIRRRLILAARLLAVVLCAVFMTWAVRSMANDTMYVFCVAGVAIVSWKDGWRRGAVAALLSAAAVDMILMEPVGRLGFASVAAVTQLVSFLLVAMLMIGVTHALRAARLQADEHAQLAETARTAAEELSAERGRFLHTLSHEVRTPINAVMGYADLLASGIGGQLNGTQGEYVTRLRSAAQHLASVANGVLDIARSDAGHQSLARRRERLAVSVESALVLVTPQARAKNVAIRLRPSDDGLAYLGDRDAVQRILVNLLGNAVKFTPSGGSVTIESSATVAPDGSSASVARAISVCVVDSGPGVATSDQVRIFEAFERATPSGTAGRVEGTGLGLTISRHLARQMGGDITVESVLGDGACFILCLPAADRAI